MMTRPAHGPDRMNENPYAAPQVEPIPAPNKASGRFNSPYGPYRTVNGIGWAVMISLVLGSVAAVVQIFALASLNAANIRWENDAEAESEVDRWIEISDSISYAEVATFLVTVVLWGVWKNKSCKNAWLFQSGKPALFRQSDQITPGWAVGWYFVPIANLWKPFQAMAFIRNQVSEHFKGGAIVGLWWAAWLVMNIGSRTLTRSNEVYTTEAANSYNQRLMIDSGLTIVASITAAILIFTLSRAQRDQAKANNLITG